jgi:zinc transport system substrate-binding protein
MMTLVKQLGGEHVQVQALVKSGTNPHHFHPTPQQISQIAQAALYVRAAVPFESVWLPRIQATNPDMHIIAPPIQLDGHHDHHDHHDDHPQTEHASLDPHFWTNPQHMRSLALTISKYLAQLIPTHTADFQQRFAAFSAQITDLDRDIQALFAPLDNRQFMVWHPAWGHFAQAYGLKQIAIQQAGKQPGAKSLVRLIKQAKKQNIRAILIQPQIQQRLANRVSQDMAIQVIQADPLAADYVANLRHVAEQLAQALAQ